VLVGTGDVDPDVGAPDVAGPDPAGLDAAGPDGGALLVGTVVGS
jgi:hypothetical protein